MPAAGPGAAGSAVAGTLAVGCNAVLWATTDLGGVATGITLLAGAIGGALRRL